MAAKLSKVVSLGVRVGAVGVRVGAVGGTVYLLNDVGAFGDVKEGEKALGKIKSVSTEDILGKEITDQLPAVEVPEEITSTLSTVQNTTNQISKDFPSYWNHGVKTTISAIIDLPKTSQHYLNVAVEEIKKAAN